jgi:hypothetical protein
MTKKWTVLFVPPSGQIEIYDDTAGWKNLVKVAHSEVEADAYLSGKVRDEDIVVLIKQGTSASTSSTSHMAGTIFKAQCRELLGLSQS